ncbi:MAG: hypothetical protein WAO00_01285 [Chthoniobacterales bacterium]
MDFKIAGVPNKDAGELIAFGVVGPLNPGRVQAAIAAILMTFRPTVKTSYEKCGAAENDDGDPCSGLAGTSRCGVRDGRLEARIEGWRNGGNRKAGGWTTADYADNTDGKRRSIHEHDERKEFLISESSA